MPCRDDGYPEFNQDKEKVDRLTRDLCDARQLIKILYPLCKDVLTVPNKKRIEKHLKGHMKHREEDKQRRLREIAEEIDSINRRVKEIRKLDGEPKQSLKDKLVSLIDEEKEVLASDPMTTELY